MRIAAVVFGGVLTIFPLTALAVTIDLDWGVGVGNQGTTIINAGDTVRWTWIDTAPHNVRSVDGGFSSGVVVSGQGTTYEVTFPTPDSFPYDCSVHPSMQGVIEVVGTSAVPILSLPLLMLLGGLLLALGLVRRWSASNSLNSSAS